MYTHQGTMGGIPAIPTRISWEACRAIYTVIHTGRHTGLYTPSYTHREAHREITHLQTVHREAYREEGNICAKRL